MEQYTRVIGIDPSLSGTGLCVIEFDDKSVKVKELETFSTKPLPHNYARITRYRSIVEYTFGVVTNSLFDVKTFICIEGYSFMAMGSSMTVMPELGALLRNRAQDLTVPWVEFSPTSVKKYGTGNGAAKKDMVLLAVHKNLGHLLEGTGLEVKDSNQADALVIASMGVDYARWKLHNIIPTKEHLEVFKKMENERFYQIE